MDFDLTATSLRQAHVIPDAAEVHGILCGLLCVGFPDPIGEWLEQVFMDAGPSNLQLKESMTLLRRLGRETEEQLADPGLAFRPLLPDDSEPLDVRAAALGEWCEGFLLGVGLGGMGNQGRLSPNVQEILRDLQEISKVSWDVEGDEDAETSYVELVEYVRVGVMLMREDLGQGDATPSRVLH